MFWQHATSAYIGERVKHETTAVHRSADQVGFPQREQVSHFFPHSTASPDQLHPPDKSLSTMMLFLLCSVGVKWYCELFWNWHHAICIDYYSAYALSGPTSLLYCAISTQTCGCVCGKHEHRFSVQVLCVNSWNNFDLTTKVKVHLWFPCIPSPCFTCVSHRTPDTCSASAEWLNPRGTRSCNWSQQMMLSALFKLQWEQMPLPAPTCSLSVVLWLPREVWHS